MDLIPKPDQVVSAASNVAHKLLYGGLADLRPMPRTLIDEGTLREVYHYRPAAKVKETGDPVLLVTPLAAPASCFDLRRGCSLVEHFVTGGRPTYLVEYGQVSFRDRNLGMEHWVDEVVPTAIREVSKHAGDRPVHVVGWGWRPVTRVYRALGGAPRPLVRWAFQLSSFQKLVTKPIAIAKNLDNTEFLAQIEAVDKFTEGMIAYPGRTFGQLYHRFVRGNGFKTGSLAFGDRTIELASIQVPVLIFAGANDGIAPVASVQALASLLPNAEEVRFEVVPGGHLGMLTGRAARRTTWVTMDEWVAQWSTPEKRTEPARKADGPTRPARNQIGSNPQRRYGSKSSRGLAT